MHCPGIHAADPREVAEQRPLRGQRPEGGT
jgi:hypothetical protein